MSGVKLSPIILPVKLQNSVNFMYILFLSHIFLLKSRAINTSLACSTNSGHQGALQPAGALVFGQLESCYHMTLLPEYPR